MAQTIKSKNYSGYVAVKVFELLNPGNVREAMVETQIPQYDRLYHIAKVIVSKVSPLELNYPEGWYYAKGYFRNKHTTENNMYSEFRMITEEGYDWEYICTECTLDSEEE